MPRLNINPTRMALGMLKKKLVTQTRGHRLLKDKRDELIRRRYELLREIKKIREHVEAGLKTAKEELFLAVADMGRKEVETALLILGEGTQVSVHKQNIMGVYVPRLSFDFENEGNNRFENPHLEKMAEEMLALKEELIRLAESESAQRLISREIESTSRRVNALEYIKIPESSETIRYIKMRLDENERANSIRLLKVKDIIIEETIK